jgi:biotin carboxylase
MNCPQNSVIIVDGYSTGIFYPQLLKKRGVSIIHVRSTSDSLKAPITDIADKSIKKSASFYSAFIDGTQTIEQICAQLHPAIPKAVIPGCETGVCLSSPKPNERKNKIPALQEKKFN